jgi:hypothetical protein
MQTLCGYDASEWPHSDGLKWLHLKSDTFDVGLKCPRPRRRGLAAASVTRA